MTHTNYSIAKIYQTIFAMNAYYFQMSISFYKTGTLEFAIFSAASSLNAYNLADCFSIPTHLPMQASKQASKLASKLA